MSLALEKMTANLDQIDAVLRLVDREVWVVTAASGTRRGGLTATWVQAASIDRERPVLLAAIAPNHCTAELIAAGGSFAAHLLRNDQGGVAYNFANGSSRNRDKLTGLAWKPGVTGSPVLTDCLAWCDCRVFARYDAGDRWFLWSDVVAAGQPGRGQPLREQEFISSLSAEQRAALLASRNEDVKIQRPLCETWRKSQPALSPPAAKSNSPRN
jgi:flavin reductase (DIM6/NTAB) family NADH-FMN oxidoreductase RutF